RQAAMDRNAGVYRTETTLKQMQDTLDALDERYQRVWVQDKASRFNTDLLEAVELGFLLDLARALVVAALARQESRGGHFREDFPTRDDANWMRHSLAFAEDGKVRLDYKPGTGTAHKPRGGKC